MDGVFSAILTLNQLVKQGIPKENISLSSIQYGDNNEKVKQMLSKRKGQMIALVDFARVPEELKGKISFWSDHHVNEAKEERTTAGSIGKTEYGSEAEHLATVHAQGLADQTTIKAITNIDSAKYNSLEDTVDLPKEFKAKGRMDRLANITNVLLSELIKNNPGAIKQLIKQSSPSLASVYNNTLKFIKLNNQQTEAIKEITSENPDWKKISTIRTSMPSKEMTSDVRKGRKAQTIKGLESKQETGKKDIEKHTTPKTTKFRGKGNVIIQSASGRGQPSRFLGSLLTKQDNTRYAALLREWPTMLQIALNPDLPEEDKKKIDLTKVVDEVIKEVSKTGGFKENWAWEIIGREAGGHAGIATIGALGTIGIMRKADRERMKYLESLKSRAKGMKKMEKIMPEKYAELKSWLEKKSKTAERRKQIVEMIRNKIIEKVNNILGGAKVTKQLKKQDRFKAKIKEDILSKIQ